ncbi:MAG TPA: M20/M25/M40 family metallo-hydrolase, partial [Telluria sp.]
MKKKYVVSCLGAAMFLPLPAGALAPAPAWITAGDAALKEIRTVAPAIRLVASASLGTVDAPERVHAIALDEDDVEAVVRILHQRLRQCGGFMYHTSEASARAALVAPAVVERKQAYAIGNRHLVEPILARMHEKNIEATITALAAFTNRYYTSQSGVDASDWLAKTWKDIAAGRADINVRQLPHKGYRQQSVILTIAGNGQPEQMVVVGAHLDSIATFRRSENAVAPGADDDASGVASMTEALRAMVEMNYRPARTLHLIAYAAEEVGLRGSQEIASQFKADKADVAGVLQLDMTNYKGAVNDIYLFTDYTDSAQNAFLEQLIASYLPGVTVGHDRCGYACSDHASWTALGYPASMPFEASKAQGNPYIHTSRDTFANSGSQAAHALKFARLAG